MRSVKNRKMKFGIHPSKRTKRKTDRSKVVRVSINKSVDTEIVRTLRNALLGSCLDVSSIEKIIKLCISESAKDRETARVFLNNLSLKYPSAKLTRSLGLIGSIELFRSNVA